MSKGERVAVYVATCAKCGGGWGMVSTTIPSDDLAATLAAWVADGAELHPYLDAQRAECLESMRQECPCPSGSTTHEAVEDNGGWPDLSCPGCGAPVAFADETASCGECGCEWTRKTVFTLSRLEVTKPGVLVHSGVL